MVIICGESALAYWRTPPMMHDIDIPLERLIELAPPPPALATRLKRRPINEGEAARLILNRIGGELIGIPLPVKVCTDSTAATSARTVICYQHGNPERLFPATIDLGGGLRVASPALAIAQVAAPRSDAEVLHLMFEICGSYCLFHQTDRFQRVFAELRSDASETRATVARYDCEGDMTYPSDRDACRWEACSGHEEQQTDLWRRPPLTSQEHLSEELFEITHVRGVRRARQLAHHVLDGSGSPFETSMALFCFLPASAGGETWEKAQLNRVIPFDERAARLAGKRYCIGDQVWIERKAVFEMNGSAYHSDRRGFNVSSGRRSALESMGFTVREIAFEQMRDPDQLDTILTNVAESFDLPLQPRTKGFRELRSDLHHDIFSIPGLHGMRLKWKTGW